jgi:hypothetical protein
MNDQPTTSESEEAQPLPPPSPLRESVSSATQRIHAIIDAAEKAAAGIIEDAEAQARRYLEESRRRSERFAEERAKELSEVTDSLIERAETVKRQSDELIAALGNARRQLEDRVIDDLGLASAGEASDAGEPERQPAPHLKPVDPVPPPAEQAPPVGPEANSTLSGESSAPARLLATQMAVAGSSRAEIESRLRSEFGIEDVGGMLDAILGPKP